MAGLLKKLGQAKQLIGEKYGSTGKTEASADFKKLEQDSDIKFTNLEKIHEACGQYLKTLAGKKAEGQDDKAKVLPLEAFGACMMKHGSLLTDDSDYGQALIKCGDAQERIATIQLEYAGHIRDSYMASLDRSMTDMKEYQQLKKKLESRRLDYDAKLNKVQKSKKEKPELEEEMRSAQGKYEESISDLQNRMLKLSESEGDHYSDLVKFVDAELAYFTQCTEVLQNLTRILTDRSVRAVARPNLSRSGSFSQRLSSITDTGSTTGRTARDMAAEPEAHDLPRSRAQSVLDNSLSRQSSASLSEAAHIGAAVGSLSQPDSRRSSVREESWSAPRATVKTVRATFEFTGEDGNELTIHKGDIITVMEEIDEGWWIGEIADPAAPGGVRRGMFPSNYTEPIVAPETPSQPLRPAPREQQAQNPAAAALAAAVTRAQSENMARTHTPPPPSPALSEAPPLEGVPAPVPRTQPSVPTATAGPIKPTRQTVLPAPAIPKRQISQPHLLSEATTNVPGAPPVPLPRTGNAGGTPPPRPSGPKPPQRPDSDVDNPARRLTAVTRSHGSLSSLARALPASDSTASPELEAAAVPNCKECGCDDFSANVFKKGSCNNCFHKHE